MQNLLGETPDFPAIFSALKEAQAGNASVIGSNTLPALIDKAGIYILLAIPLECNDDSKYHSQELIENCFNIHSLQLPLELLRLRKISSGSTDGELILLVVCAVVQVTKNFARSTTPGSSRLKIGYFR
jgi:hypothetical protein